MKHTKKISIAPAEFEERLETARNNNKDSNCLGTALFLAGLCPREYELDPETFFSEDLLELDRIKKPELYAMVTWQQGRRAGSGTCPVYGFRESWDDCVWTCHAAIITSLDPLLVTHRPGNHMRLKEDVHFRGVHRNYKGKQGSRCFVRYYKTPLIDGMTLA